jgi:hypothetical protein
MKTGSIRTLWLICALAMPLFIQQMSSQQKAYNWVPGNDETVRLDPGYYHTGPTYPPGSGARMIHVDISGQQPVTLAMVSAQDWSEATQRPEMMSNLRFLCVQEHVIHATYTCNLPLTAPMVLLVRDERNERGMFVGIGEVTRGRDYDKHHDQPANSARSGDADRDERNADRVIAGVETVLGGPTRRQFFYPNDVHIQYYDWSCTENCNLPDPPRPKTFDWVPGTNETVRLDPAGYYQGATWPFGERDVVYHVGVEAERPVTIAVVAADDWNNALQQRMGKDLNNIEYTCLQQHVVRATFACKIPVVWSPSFLIIRDERDPGHADHDRQNPGRPVPVAALGVVVTGHDSERRFIAPNDVHLQGYLWRCVDACDQPDFGWVSQVSEKYPLTRVLKLYGATVVPDHDGEQVSIKVKSPVPMAVAMLPARVASQLYGKPDMFESAVENSSCAQRGVQNATFQCTFNVADGPQSLVLLPETGADIPSHKKTEVQLQALKCVNNCGSLGTK